MIQQHVLRVLLHVLCLIPLVYLIIGILQQTLGADPQEVILHETGIWSLRLLLITLAVTPLRKLTGLHQLARYRRLLGLHAFSYAVWHLLIFLFFFIGFEWHLFIEEVVERPYITVGLAAFVILLLLAATSTQSFQKKLGKRWKKLHWWIYPASILAIIHFIWQVKLDINESVVYACILIVLFLLRIKKVRQMILFKS